MRHNKFFSLVASLIMFASQVALANPPVEPELLNVVVYLDSSGQMQPLERQTATVKTENKAFLGIGGAKRNTVTAPGSTSNVRMAAGESHEFAVKLTGSDPGKFQLYKLSIVDDHREVVVETTNPGIVPFDVASFGASFKFITAASMLPGEYCFSANDSNNMFCFENK
jgi:hypothetical protein